MDTPKSQPATFRLRLNGAGEIESSSMIASFLRWRRKKEVWTVDMGAGGPGPGQIHGLPRNKSPLLPFSHILAKRGRKTLLALFSQRRFHRIGRAWNRTIPGAASGRSGHASLAEGKEGPILIRFPATQLYLQHPIPGPRIPPPKCSLPSPFGQLHIHSGSSTHAPLSQAHGPTTRTGCNQ